MAFGHSLRRQREEREMTLTELARRVEISIAYLSRIERERENPPPDCHSACNFDPCAPLGVDRRDAFQLAICRAWSSSNLTGLLYPSAECRRFVRTRNWQIISAGK